jgi:membrane associated rhomboid family serine protease
MALFACDPWRVAHGEVWRLLTAGVLSDPQSIGPLLFTLMGLYFFATELETLWGGARFVRFLVWSTLASNAIAVAVELVAPRDLPMLHAAYPLVGGYAMTTAVIIAWSRINVKTPVRLFYLVPMTGRTIFWLTVAMCVWCLYRPGSEGPVAPLGGVAAGMALAGSPSPLRRAYLKLKLRWLQARGADPRRTPTAHEIAFGKPQSSRRPRTGGPVLRVVAGGKDGKDDESDKPKDKRYLN